MLKPEVKQTGQRRLPRKEESLIRALGNRPQNFNEEAQDLEMAALVLGLLCDLEQINLTFLGLSFPIHKMGYYFLLTAAGKVKIKQNKK